MPKSIDATDNHPFKAFTRLNRANREVIERYLTLGRSCTEIARELNCAVSTVTREIKTQRTPIRPRARTATGNHNILCALYNDCKKTNVCMVCSRKCHPRCKTCKEVRCSTSCRDYVKRICPTTARAPYVCNGCPKATGCGKEKYFYRAKEAQAKAMACKTASREGIDSTPEIIEAMANIIRPLLLKGQSPAQIWLSHADELPISRRTFYRYVEQGLFGLCALDLRRKATYKQRKKERREDKWIVPQRRNWSDFLALSEEEREGVVEMDCVCGTKDDEGAILTLHFKAIHFQFGIHLGKHDRTSVVKAFDFLEGVLGDKSFRELFSVILTDRGFEFRDSEGMERNERCKVYFCEPRRSDQKASAEKNHVELRKRIPKGTSVDNLSQDEVSLAFSHVNSTPRRSLFGATPMQLAKTMLPNRLFEALGLEEISADEVDLRPQV